MEELLNVRYKPAIQSCSWSILRVGAWEQITSQLFAFLSIFNTVSCLRQAPAQLMDELHQDDYSISFVLYNKGVFSDSVLYSVIAQLAPAARHTADHATGPVQRARGRPKSAKQRARGREEGKS